MYRVPGLTKAVIDSIPDSYLSFYLCQHAWKVLGISIHSGSLHDYVEDMPDQWRTIFLTSLLESTFTSGGFELFFDQYGDLDQDLLIDSYQILGLGEMADLIFRVYQKWENLHSQTILLDFGDREPACENDSEECNHAPNLPALHANLSANDMWDDLSMDFRSSALEEYNLRFLELATSMEPVKTAYIRNNLKHFVDTDALSFDTYYKNFDFLTTWEDLSELFAEYSEHIQPLDILTCSELCAKVEEKARGYVEAGDKAAAELSYHRLFMNMSHELNEGMPPVLDAVSSYADLLDSMERSVEASILRAEKHFINGHLYFHMEKIDQSLKELELAANNCPDILSNRRPHSIYGLWAQVLSKADRLEETIEITGKALRYGEDAFHREILGSAYLRLGELETALKEFNRAIELNDRKASLFWNRGFVHLHLGDHDAAISAFQKTKEMAPDSFERWELFDIYLHADCLKGAYRELEEEKEKDPEAPDIFIKRGRLYFYEEKFELALLDLEKAVELDPENPEAYNELGNIYMVLDRKEEGLQCHDRAVSLDPQNPEWICVRCYTYMDLERYDDAFNEADRLIKSVEAASQADKPIDWPPPDIEFDEEIENISICEEYKEPDPSSILPAYTIRSICNLRKLNFEEALADADKAIKILPFSYEDPHLIKANVAIQKGNYDESFAHIDTALKHNQRSDWAHCTLAEVYLITGESEKAIESAGKAIEINKKYGCAYLIRSIAYKKIGDEKKAKTDYDLAQKFEYEPEPEEVLNKIYREVYPE